MPKKSAGPAETVEETVTVSSEYVFPNNQPVVELDCTQAFAALTPKEKLYAHYLGQASWTGGLIVLIQTSPEAPHIFAMLQRVFTAHPINELKEYLLEHVPGLTEDDYLAFLVYASGIFTNMGNYKGFGDTKFVPNLSPKKFEAIIRVSTAWKNSPASMQKLWDLVKVALYSVNESNQQLGLGQLGMTTYFTPNCTKDDADIITKYLQHKGFEAYNQRVFKKGDIYEIRLASVEKDSQVHITSPLEEFEGNKFQITRGDYSELLTHVNNALEKAKDSASNDTEVKMINKYIHSFRTGELSAHKDGSRHWIKNRAPPVETYMGFIENYRDPNGQRGEFEGMVAMVNRPMSEKFTTLVDHAERFLKLLPWDASFEKDKFLRPDFTSLDVLTFSGSGIPAGINIPNYDEIRQNEGFKNVSLGNVISASYKEDVVPFVTYQDQDLMIKYRIPAFEVQVALHELLGHGSGKLFRCDKEGNFNFDSEIVMNPLNGAQIDLWYKDGETYDSKFTTISSAYEECRAECVGLYLSLNDEILKLFGYVGEAAEDVKYINWFSFLWNAVSKALEMYSPRTKTWLQAHSQARFVILQVLLEAGEGLVDIKETKGKNGRTELLLTVDRWKIADVGKNAVGQFLLKLQIYKATGDVTNAQKMFDHYSEVNEKWAKWREIVLEHKQPRKMFVQANTVLHESGDVHLTTYVPSHEGLIRSWIERFPSTDVGDMLSEIALRDRAPA